MTSQEIADEIARELDDLIAEAEFELDRDLTPEERQSIIDEYLAELDDDDDESDDEGDSGTDGAESFFAEPLPRGAVTEAKSEVALAGADGKKAATLLARAKAEGAKKLQELVAAAVKRLVERGGAAALRSKSLLDDDELAALADQIAATNAPADLLGRARIRERVKAAEARQGREGFTEPAAFHTFDETGPLEPMTPTRALEYFRKLVPELGIDPKRWGDLLQRQAFTLAAAADEVVLAKVKNVIRQLLETGEGISTAPKRINEILDAAGVGPTNNGYSEMLVRTNLMDSYNIGAEEEGLDVADTFPWFMYANPDDGRSRPTHAAKNGKYYENKVGSTFTIVRGTDIEDVAQCRCTPIFVDKWEVEKLMKQGVRAETSW